MHAVTWPPMHEWPQRRCVAEGLARIEGRPDAEVAEDSDVELLKVLLGASTDPELLCHHVARQLSGLTMTLGSGERAACGGPTGAGARGGRHRALEFDGFFRVLAGSRCRPCWRQRLLWSFWMAVGRCSSKVVFCGQCIDV